MRRALVLDIICSLLILLMMYAAVSKLLDYRNFHQQMISSPILKDYVGWLVWSIPAIEIIVSLLLIINRTRFVGLLAAFSVMAMFTAYILFVLYVSPHTPCSCGGVIENLSWGEHLVFNIFFMLLSFLGIILYYKESFIAIKQEKPKTWINE